MDELTVLSSLRVQQFYERLAVEREGMLDKLGELYAEDVTFWDPFRSSKGLPALRAIFARWFEQYRAIRFENFRFFGDGPSFSMHYEMHLKMRVGPWFRVDMASLCVSRDGRITELRDYYDFPSSIVSPFRLLRWAYLQVVNRLFM